LLLPLIHEEEKDPSELSRKDEIFISDSGLISIAGGKLTGYRKMAHRVINTVLKTQPKKQRETFKTSSTDSIALVNPSMHSNKEVKAYQLELEKKLEAIGIDDSYYAWYLCTTFGKKADVIIEKINFFKEGSILEKLIRAELWYCIHYEMTNSLADFFVRRTGRLYFNINSIQNYLEAIIKDCINYLDWDEKRIRSERDTIDMLLSDATTYYEKEF